jgi:general secretion pathway protein J
MTSHERMGGFTLVELLVATTLLALLSMVLFGGLRFGARAWEAGGESIERTSETEAAQEVLRRTLVESFAFRGTGEGEQPAFSGQADRIAFVAPMPRHAGAAGPGRYAIWLDGSGNLSMAWEPRRPEREIDAAFEGEPSVVLQHVAGLRFSYFGAERTGQPAAWQDRWESPGLPLLIRIELGFEPSDRRRWPDLVIAPRLAGRFAG